MSSKKVFVVLEQTGNTTRLPDTGETLLFADDNGDLVTRQNNGDEKRFEGAFDKNTAFNKNYGGSGGLFGTADNIARTDHSHSEFVGIGSGDMEEADYANTGGSAYPLKTVDRAQSLHNSVDTVTTAQAKPAYDHTSLTNHPHSVTKAQVGLSEVPNIKHNLAATTAPTVNEDSNDGYAIGSVWVNLTTEGVYMCTDATPGVANWADLTGLTSIIDHNTTHQNGGGDEINVAGLSGLLADPQTPDLHKASHENGGLDEISVAGLSGLLATAQTPIIHAATHGSTGSDPINFDNIADTASYVKMRPDERDTLANQLDLIGLGTVSGAVDFDVSAAYFQRATISANSSITISGGEVNKVYTVNLYITASAAVVLTFPPSWGWTTRPASDQIALASGEEVNLAVQLINNTDVRAAYKLMDI
jgi:hypothetical protein